MIAGIVVLVCKAWLGIGLVVALWFTAFGVSVAPDARGSYAFRPLLLPGVALLWPFVLWRWRKLRLAALQGES